ncbi:MAG: tryptophan--tRNA ligase [Actinomycetaceae bacterium]|nr:tryptophan--tRNA ligase [Actinomycetaceae bacterium]
MSTEEKIANSTSVASYQHARQVSERLHADIALNPSRYRMLTGDRPTGHLHIGHYFGSLLNRVALQNQGIESWILVADYQVITDRDGTGPIQERAYSLVTDYLAAGIDPEKSTIFTHSAVPALNQLMLPFLSLVTDAELRRNPTVKSELEATEGRPLSGLMLTYPVHQAADILFCKANIVPVGKDQLPHLEQTRVIAQRFDKRYGRPEGSDSPIFPAPQALLSESDTILGLDGTKMSKSRGNTIELRMSADETAKKIKKAVTDSDRHITYDPINRPEVSNLLTIGALASNSTPETLADEIGDGGAGTLKKVVTEALNEFLAPLREKRSELEKNTDYIHTILSEGIERANEQADKTLTEVRDAMHMTY